MKTFDGYKKQALTDVYALLAGGGHKPLSEFSMAHTHPYLPLAGGTMLGALNFKNGTWNLMGDDAYIGDCNVAGMIGIKAANTTYPGIAFFNNENTRLGNLTVYSNNIKYRTYSLQFLDNGNTSVNAGTWMNPFSTYNASAIADGQAICVWGQSSYLGNLASDSGDMSLWLKRVNANAATLNMVLDGEYYANGNLRLAHISEIPTSLKNPYALTISLNGVSQGPYDGSAAKNINITPSFIGAATSGHNHDSSYVKYAKVTKSTADSANANPYIYNIENEAVISGYYNYWYILNLGRYSRGNFGTLIAMPYQDSLTDSELFIRSAKNGSWRAWRRVLHSNNYASILDSRYYTESESDGRFVNVTGDTMTGPLQLNGSPSQGNPSLQINYTSNFEPSDLTIGLLKFGKLTTHDMYLGISPTTRTHFGRVGYFMHVSSNCEFTWASSGWTNLMALTGGTGNLWVKGSVTAGSFIKSGSSNSYILLGGGGHKLISDFAISEHNHDDRYIRKWYGVYGIANKFLKISISDEKGWIRLEVSDSNNGLSGGYGIYIIGWGWHGNDNVDNLDVKCLYSNDPRYITALKVVRTSRNNYDFYFLFAGDASYPGYTITYSNRISIDCTVTAVTTIPTTTWTSSLSTLLLNADMLDGYHASAFATASHTHSYLPLSGGTVNGNLAVTGSVTFLSEGKLKIWNVASTRNSNFGAEMVFVQTSIDGADPETKWPDKYRNDLFLQPKGGHVHIGPIETAQNYTCYVAGTLRATDTITAPTFSGALSGNASSATKLTSSAGSATLPIYFSDGKPVACTASSVFSNLSNSGNNISITVAGQNRTLTVGYASAASKINSRGNLTAYEEGSTTKGESGVNLYTVYNNGYPVTYGNLLHINGSGAGQILAEWCGNSTLGHLYYRSKRDNSEHGWSAWGKVAFVTDNVTSATKLQTVRTIWGLSFNGTTNIDNTLRIRLTTGNYCEGIRIQTADGAWSTIILGATADSGTNTNAWSIHRKADNNFAISRNSSDGINGLVMTSVGMGLGTTAPTHRLDVRGDTKITGSIRDLAIGGGIYWNPYVESTTDGSDAASITVVKSGVTGGTTLVLRLMNDANDTILFLTSTAAKLYHNSYPILTTLNTYVSNNKGYINGVEITLVNNASSASIATKLASSGYANNALSYYQTDQAFDGSATGWAHYIIANHGDGASYYHYTIRLPFSNVPQYRRLTGSTSNVTSWYNFITAENISSQSVNYATSAGNSDKVDGQHFNWNNNKNDHTYLWAASNNGNAYLVHRASISVNYATSSGNADTVDGYHKTDLIGNLSKGNWNPRNINLAMDWHYNGGDISISENSGKIFISIDGSFWLNEGQYRVLDTSDAGSLSVKYANSAGNADTLDGLHANAFATAGHTHNYDNVYSKLGHTHDNRYYTESEVNNLLSNKLNISNFNWTNLSGKLVAGNEFNIVNAEFNAGMWFNYLPINDRSKTATITGYHFGNGATGYASIKASGFIKNGSSSSYVLLGDGGHKAISDFATSGHTHTLTLASDTGANPVALVHGGKYKLTVGGSSIIFTLPTDNDTNPANYYWANVKVSATSSTTTSPTFNTCYTNSWFRSYGKTGWYNETYYGGWYMSDTTWIRTHNSKGIYTDTGTIHNLGHAWLAYNSDSKVGIGTTSPSSKLHVVGDGRITGSLYANYLHATNTVYAEDVNANSAVYTSDVYSDYINVNYDIIADNNITADGVIYATHFYENSDIRYKKILRNLLINSNTIANLPLFDFEWVENNTIGTGTSALAVQQILPNLVSGTDKLTLDYGVLGTIAGITACKELVTLKSELLQLKEKVKLLEDKLRKYESTL